jgi:ribosome-binding factor A
MTRRTEKVSALLHQQIGEYLSLMELPSLTTISKVEVSPDLKWCKVAVTVLGSEEERQKVLKKLEENLPELQNDLNHKLTMKFVPKISFVLDYGEEYAARINELIRKTHEE